MANKLSSIYFGSRKNGEVITERTSELAAYYAAVNVFPVLTTDEEVELAFQTKAGNKAAKEKLINSNLRGVISIVREHYDGCGGCLTTMDLISAGNIGLMKAVDKFDPTIGVKFLSFAVNDIRAAILEEIKKSSRIVADYHKDAITKHTSLDAPLTDDDNNATLGDVLCTTTDKEPNESLLTDLLRVINILLDEKEANIICVLYGIGTTAKSRWQIAEDYGQTEERIRQISVTAIGKLKANKNAMILLSKYI